MYYIGNGNEAFLVETAIVTITFSIIRIAIEAFQIIYYTNFCYFLEPENRMELYLYFLEPENWMELYLYPSSIAFVVFGLAADCQCPESWQWEFGAVTILMAWLNVVLFLKKFPYTGVYVLMFTRILKTILKMLLLPILCVVSFGITFYMLFFRPVREISIQLTQNFVLIILCILFYTLCVHIVCTCKSYIKHQSKCYTQQHKVKQSAIISLS